MEKQDGKMTWLLAEELQRTHENAPKGEVVFSIVLFGIQYAEEISSVPELIKRSGIPKDYAKEIYAGIKLAKYVCLKNENIGKIG